MQRDSDLHGPRVDDEMEHEVRGMVQGNRPTRAQEWRDPEPPAGDDDPWPVPERGEVANPERTQVDGAEPDADDDVHETRQRHDPHDQPWPAVAKEVKQAVDDADGPLD
jgi:hypothetical protein